MEASELQDEHDYRVWKESLVDKSIRLSLAKMPKLHGSYDMGEWCQSYQLSCLSGDSVCQENLRLSSTLFIGMTSLPESKLDEHRSSRSGAFRMIGFGTLHLIRVLVHIISIG
jgi:hypothetical protein